MSCQVGVVVVRIMVFKGGVVCERVWLVGRVVCFVVVCGDWVSLVWCGGVVVCCFVSARLPPPTVG